VGVSKEEAEDQLDADQLFGFKIFGALHGLIDRIGLEMILVSLKCTTFKGSSQVSDDTVLSQGLHYVEVHNHSGWDDIDEVQGV
jgi:hypothetical protein